MLQSGRVLPVYLLLIALAVAISVTYVVIEPGSGTPSPEFRKVDGMLWPQTKPVGDLSLIDHNGEPFDTDRLKNRWTMLFFGYTHCPDVCPGTMTTLKWVQKSLEIYPDIRTSTAFVLASVDPARDTPAVLASYVTGFSSSFVGVTGEPGAIAAFARGLGISYAPVTEDHSQHQHMPPSTDNPPLASTAGYQIGHTASVLLISPDAELVGLFSPPLVAEDIVQRYIAMRAVITGHSD